MWASRLQKQRCVRRTAATRVVVPGGVPALSPALSEEHRGRPAYFLRDAGRTRVPTPVQPSASSPPVKRNHTPLRPARKTLSGERQRIHLRAIEKARHLCAGHRRLRQSLADQFVRALREKPWPSKRRTGAIPSFGPASKRVEAGLTAREPWIWCRGRSVTGTRAYDGLHHPARTNSGARARPEGPVVEPGRGAADRVNGIAQARGILNRRESRGSQNMTVRRYGAFGIGGFTF